MSRCFPYPPPGQLRNGARGETVSESIKVQTDLKNAIKEHDKHKKKEKKSSRKEKKDACYVASVASCSQPEKKLLNGKEEEAERSSLTEEHGPPVCFQSLGYSSDSPRSSNKRKRDDMLYNPPKAQGNIIRFRLQRHKEPGASCSEEQLCSTSGRADFLSEQRQEEYSSINIKTGETSKPIIPTPCADLVNKEKPSTSSADLDKTEKSSHHSRKIEKREKKLRKAESRYKSLFEDWVPPSMQYEPSSIDDDLWLCAAESQEEHRGQKLKTSNHDEPCHGGSILWPCARYLPQAEIYALPFTIPF